MKAFLTPMSGEEELRYLQKMKQGDIEARNTLIERNMRLVAHIAKKYQTPEEEVEDFESSQEEHAIISVDELMEASQYITDEEIEEYEDIGTYGLIKAIMTYDPQKGNRLATYSAKCIENELLMYKRARKKAAKDVSLYEPIATDREGNHLRLMDILEADEDDMCDALEHKECMELVKKNIKNILSAREYRVIYLRYGLNHSTAYTQIEVAKMLNISRSYVSRIEKRALDKMREYLQQ